MTASTFRPSLSFTLVCAGGLWAAWNGVGFVVNPATRHRAESAWFIFTAILLISGLMLGRQLMPAAEAGENGRISPPAGGRWPMAFIAASLLLYSPVLGTGLLSDDFVLLDRVSRGALVDRAWDYVRPLPLAVWWGIDIALPAAAVPFALHAWNVSLHGLNAWLVFLLGRTLSLHYTKAAIAGLLFLACPVSVEAVAWNSGMFDLVLTAIILTTANVLLGVRLSLLHNVTFAAGMALAAVLTKETAVAMPLLLAVLIPFAARDRRRAMLWATAACAVVVGVYSLWRIATGIPGLTSTPPEGYLLKELLSRPFGLLGFGLHQEVLVAFPILALVLAILWPMALTQSARHWPAQPRRFLMLAAAAIWVMCSVLPVFTMFFVSAELEGSRYIYLGSSLWFVAVIAAVGNDSSSKPDNHGLAISVVLIVVSAAIVLAHQRPWLRAAEVRDRVLAAAESLPVECAVQGVTGLPDHVAGAYVFRNGFPEAVGAQPSSGVGVMPCGLRWDGARFVSTR
jgi:hypothetical protein